MYEFVRVLVHSDTQPSHTNEIVGELVLQSGHPSLKVWTLPPLPTNDLNPDRSKDLIELGRSLFFDERLSAGQDRSCATCHRPDLGWSDGRPTAAGLLGQPLARATPTLTNAGYGHLFAWDGRANSLEDQALQPIFNDDEMGLKPEELFALIRADSFYSQEFVKLFPGQPINEETVSTAFAAFERTIVVKNTRFDQWISGDSEALSASEIRGFGVFLDPKRGSCGTCHAAPNFTDDGFHNIGLESINRENPDLGRYNIRPVQLMRGAFKTPTLRNIALTAPYFHDGSENTLEDVIEHYVRGGDVKDNLSPEMKELTLDDQEKSDLIAFLNALSEVPDEYQQDTIDQASTDDTSQ